MAEDKKSSTYEELIEEALANANADRARAIEAFDNTKHIYDIDPDNKNVEQLQGLMLVGQNIPKLLELAHKSNEQIIKLAQLREKKDSRVNKGEDLSRPITIEDLKKYRKAQGDE